jgi:hypothetical protein
VLRQHEVQPRFDRTAVSRKEEDASIRARKQDRFVDGRADRLECFEEPGPIYLGVNDPIADAGSTAEMTGIRCDRHHRDPRA